MSLDVFQDYAQEMTVTVNVELYAQGRLEDEDLERFVNRRAELALRPLRDRFDSVSVFVRQREDAEPGKDNHCRVVIRSNTRADVVVGRSSRNLVCRHPPRRR